VSIKEGKETARKAQEGSVSIKEGKERARKAQEKSMSILRLYGRGARA